MKNIKMMVNDNGNEIKIQKNHDEFDLSIMRDWIPFHTTKLLIQRPNTITTV